MISTIKIKVVTGELKMPGGKVKKLISTLEGRMAIVEGRIYLKTPYNKTLTATIKSFEGHHYHGNIPGSDYKPKPLPPEVLKDFGHKKCWSIVDSHRNRFQLNYLLGGNPYARYDLPIPELEYVRSLYNHQKEMTNFLMARHYAIIAGEMGTGKTLCAIEVMERSGHDDWYYVAPKSVLRTIERELRIWKSTVRPLLLTYNALVKLMNEWPEGKKAPKGIIYDESARIKTPTSQRAQAAKQLADGVRADWGDDGFVIEMSGAPAPLAPTDWWHQCEVACPGYLKEGTLAKFKVSLGIFKEEQSFAGGVFLKQVTWLDDETKCKICGKLESDNEHLPGAAAVWHPHTKSVNEVARLYKRMGGPKPGYGLVIVKLKKDCLDLPDKVYREIECKPTPAVLRAAAMIARTSKTTIQALTLLRELSDGFQYIETKGELQQCPLCHGACKIDEQQPVDSEINPDCEYCVEGAAAFGGPCSDHQKYETVRIDCPNCDGAGEAHKIIRETKQVDCPKEDALREVLDEHHEIGRLVTYAGFTGSVERCISASLAEGWDVIRVDGRGWKFFGKAAVPERPDFLGMFQEGFKEYPRLNFIGQAAAAGSGHTLTASPSIFYYSNDFNADSRIQSEDRIHRIGMDVNRGATIMDAFHLPSDRLVFNNLKNKRRLQSISMGQLVNAIESAGSEERLF